MINMATGLDALTKIAKQSQERNSGDFEKVNWFSIKKSGESRRVRFLQELDGDSKNYLAKNGLAHVFAEHTDPDNFRKKMKCSMEDEGKCFGCEQHKANPKAGWRAKYRLYIAVLTKNDEGEDEVQIMSQSTTSRSIFNALVEYAQDTNSITDREFKVTRNGEGKDTSYLAMGKDRPEEPFDDFDKWEVPDIEKVATRTIPYEDQASFFNDGAITVDAPANSGGGWGTNETKDSPLSSW